MVSIPSLWLPILLSSVVVFFASWLIHMLLPYHRTDFARVPSEDEVQDALRKFNLPPGDYMLPHAGGPEGMKSPDFQAKIKKGPVVVMTVFGPAAMNMGSSLVQWFVYLLVVGVLVAYVAGRALAVGLFLTTLSFLFTTPGIWARTAGGYPVPGPVAVFLLKDVLLLGIAVRSLRESLGAIPRSRGK